MVAMVMRDENIGQLPPLLAQGCQDRRFFACIDAGGSARRRIMEQHAEIVGTNAKLMNNERHRFSFSNSGPYIVCWTGEKEALWRSM
jgi:hypothetical protein